MYVSDWHGSDMNDMNDIPHNTLIILAWQHLVKIESFIERNLAKESTNANIGTLTLIEELF